MLELKDVVVRDDRGLAVVNGVSLDVHAGEIVALAGVQGNGQTELAEAIAGLRHVESGTITLRGRDITNRSPREILDAGLGHVPEDRQRDGLVLSMSLADNLVLNTPRRAPFARRGTRNLNSVVTPTRRHWSSASTFARRGSTRPRAHSRAATSKRSSSRANCRAPCTCFMASQPTRGLDVGSIEYVHRQIVNQRNEGLGIFIISSELDEVVALGDRIAVMYAGRITGVVDPLDEP